jgi:hypothetical protein
MGSFAKSSYKDYDKFMENRRKDRKRTKERNLEYIKSKTTPCLFCGSDERIEWHHFNPATKDKKHYYFLGCSLDKIDEELEKCWQLCYDCHKKLHRRMVDPLPICYE